MKLALPGGAETVTGSRSLLQAHGKPVLIDGRLSANHSARLMPSIRKTSYLPGRRNFFP